MFVTARTLTHEDRIELTEELCSALSTIGIDAEATDDTLRVDGTEIEPRLEERAHPTPAALAALVQKPPIRLPAVVVSDRISDAGRDVLRDSGWGWLDRRGHIRLWTRGMRIETDFDGHDTESRHFGNAWTTVGLEVAVAALLDPTEPVNARRMAKLIGRSAGSTHELIGRFTDIGLIGQRTRLPLLPELFWETSAHWPDDGWTPLPIPIEELADVLDTTDLIRVDERAATLGGAQISAVGDLPARCYISSAHLLRRARALAERDEPTACWVRDAPVRWIPVLEGHPPDPAHPWEVAHPIVCALRLASDLARGREIVEAWGIVPQGDR